MFVSCYAPVRARMFLFVMVNGQAIAYLPRSVFCVHIFVGNFFENCSCWWWCYIFRFACVNSPHFLEAFKRLNNKIAFLLDPLFLRHGRDQLPVSNGAKRFSIASEKDNQRYNHCVWCRVSMGWARRFEGGNGWVPCLFLNLEKRDMLINLLTLASWIIGNASINA